VACGGVVRWCVFGAANTDMHMRMLPCKAPPRRPAQQNKTAARHRRGRTFLYLSQLDTCTACSRSASPRPSSTSGMSSSPHDCWWRWVHARARVATLVACVWRSALRVCRRQRTPPAPSLPAPPCSAHGHSAARCSARSTPPPLARRPRKRAHLQRARGHSLGQPRVHHV
jgi:hypothetical protein